MGKGRLPSDTRCCCPRVRLLPSTGPRSFLAMGVRNAPYGRFNWKPVLGEGQGRKGRMCDPPFDHILAIRLGIGCRRLVPLGFVDGAASKLLSIAASSLDARHPLPSDWPIIASSLASVMASVRGSRRPSAGRAPIPARPTILPIPSGGASAHEVADRRPEFDLGDWFVQQDQTALLRLLEAIRGRIASDQDGWNAFVIVGL